MVGPENVIVGHLEMKKFPERSMDQSTENCIRD
jgi:hypothetical protein